MHVCVVHTTRARLRIRIRIRIRACVPRELSASAAGTCFFLHWCTYWYQSARVSQSSQHGLQPHCSLMLTVGLRLDACVTVMFGMLPSASMRIRLRASCMWGRSMDSASAATHQPCHAHVM